MNSDKIKNPTDKETKLSKDGKAHCIECKHFYDKSILDEPCVNCKDNSLWEYPILCKECGKTLFEDDINATDGIGNFICIDCYKTIQIARKLSI